VHVSEFDYELPEEAIAQHPLDDRTSSRLLDATGAESVHRRVADVASLVGPGDVVVVNDTRVILARLHLTKPTGGAVEVLLLEDVGEHWEALVRPSKRVAPGSTFQVGELQVRVGERLDGGVRAVQLQTDGDLFEALASVGEMPLPPYITARLSDAERYQTTYSDRPASAAAPTAGLHFTPELLAAVEAAGAEVHRVELVVGLDTFRPVSVEDLDQHEMHTERYSVPQSTMAACRDAERVIAIGTTATRALESAAVRGELRGRTNLFIQRGYEFQVVDTLLTNFHLPKSTLLVMIDALIGPRWRNLYIQALMADYRFLSFGDAMLIGRGR
jgi:S-adenosylmethionine:tRNA ribosyltransferase-isomerase